jgi:hypothetical protein
MKLHITPPAVDAYGLPAHDELRHAHVAWLMRPAAKFDDPVEVATRGARAGAYLLERLVGNDLTPDERRRFRDLGKASDFGDLVQLISTEARLRKALDAFQAAA